MDRGKIDIGRVKMLRANWPWWANCPVCPAMTGLQMFRTFAEAIAWKDAHLVMRHPLEQHIFYVERDGRREVSRG